MCLCEKEPVCPYTQERSVKDRCMCYIHISNSIKDFVEKNLFALKFCTVSTMKKTVIG